MDYNLLIKAIVLFPLFGSIIVGLFGKYLGKIASHSLTIIGVMIACILSLYVNYHLYNGGLQELNTTWYIWANTGGNTLQVGILIDKLSALMMFIVSFVSLMVHIYTIGYMKGDPGYQRFFSYISLFTFAMLTLVVSNNLLQLFFGWEGVGLASYLLIGFWYKKETAIFANLKAFLVNRVSDLGMLLGLCLIWYYCDSLDFAKIFAQTDNIATMQMNILGNNYSVATVIAILLLIGAMGKSAQMPLHVWLPDSMEGPTPISALIHAATMVTAGVFMIARMSPLYELTETALSAILVIGALTSIMMGLVAIVQNDIKKIIAYSTLSQLGYMMVALGASAYAAAIFHLMTHAFFKALLFLGAGSVIIAMHHEQDISKMGRLRKYLPITYSTMLIGTLAIIGFPGTAGFYSKDLIIESVALSAIPGSDFAYWCVLIGVFVTALYSFRLLFVVFFTNERFNEKTKSHLHEPDLVVTVPLIILAIPSLLVGAVFMPQIMQGYFGDSIQVQQSHNVIAMFAENYHGIFGMITHSLVTPIFWLAALGTLVAWYTCIKQPKITEQLAVPLQPIYKLLINKYWFDELYQLVFVRGTKIIGSLCWRIGDRGLIDSLAVHGTAKIVVIHSRLLKKIQSGYLYHYAFCMVAGFFALLLWMRYKG